MIEELRRLVDEIETGAPMRKLMAIEAIHRLLNEYRPAISEAVPEEETMVEDYNITKYVVSYLLEEGSCAGAYKLATDMRDLGFVELPAGVIYGRVLALFENEVTVNGKKYQRKPFGKGFRIWCGEPPKPKAKVKAKPKEPKPKVKRGRWRTETYLKHNELILNWLSVNIKPGEKQSVYSLAKALKSETKLPIGAKQMQRRILTAVKESKNPIFQRTVGGQRRTIFLGVNISNENSTIQKIEQYRTV